MAIVVAFNSIKGGVGKTTLAAQFTAYLSKFSKVGVLNSDSENALEMWISRRGDKDLALIENIELLPVDFDFDKQGKHYDYIICDLAGGDNKISRQVLAKNANIVISPFKPSQFDIDTVVKHNTLLSHIKKEFNPTLKSFYWFNLCNTNLKSKAFTESSQIFSDLIKQKIIDSTLIKSPLFAREILSTSAADGLSCFDLGYKAKKSAAEIEPVIKKILKLKDK
uniref:Plasmid segregation oscillating ATPase ParF n=1 Tax=Histophilus somni (strain 129Pt) TaxID=205914 RepID=Q0I2B1_HISS1